MTNIVSEIKKVILRSKVLKDRKLPNQVLRSLTNPKHNIIMLAIEASKKTGDATWIFLILKEIENFLKEINNKQDFLREINNKQGVL